MRSLAAFFRRWLCDTFHHTSGPWHDVNGEYWRCLDCGRRIPWNQPQLLQRTATQPKGH